MRPARTFLASSCAILLVLILSASFCGESATGEKKAGGEKLVEFAFSQPHMGTLFRILLFAPGEKAAKLASDAAFARIAELDAVMSDYKPDSELMQLSKKSGGEPVAVSLDLFRVLARAEEIARQTDGAFDVSIGPVVKLWRKARRTRMLPDAEELKKAIARVDFRKIKLDPMRRTVQLLLAGMLLDLGGIAKGYAADAALETLANHGLPRALVIAGGDIVAGEAPPGKKGWKVGIAPLKNPDDPPTHHLLLRHAAASTSGDAEQHVEIAGKRYSHIMDPRTGLGLTGRRSVTVVAPDSTTADALATALCVMGQEESLRFLEAHPELAGLTVYERDGKEVAKATKSLERFLHP